MNAFVGLQILIVEDDDDTAQSLTMLLSTQNHQVRWVRDGLSALDEADANVPDLILLDLGLPELSGYEVARRLKERQLTKDPLVVVTTGNGHEPDTGRLREMGIDLYLVKPIDPAALLSLIARFRRVLA
jgi:two-component system, chemotaxis family, CheB/CheR fusion protein